MTRKTNTSSIYQEVTDSIIELLEESLEFKKPWISISDGFLQHRNASTQRFYSLINQILLTNSLELHGFQNSRWMTFNQATELGAKIKKGSKSSKVIFNKYFCVDEDGQKIVPQPPIEEHANYEKRWYLKFFRLFNVEQIENLDGSYYIAAEDSFPPKDEQLVLADIEQYLLQTGADIIHQGNEAFFIPSVDKIFMPPIEQFIGTDEYISTLFHELVHWTGHKSRLARTSILERGKSKYAYEELVAELGAAYLLAHFERHSYITQNAAYIKSWLSALKNDNRFIFQAAADAEKAAKYLIALHSNKTGLAMSSG
jgi:antirestriction protein ArdC